MSTSSGNTPGILIIDAESITATCAEPCSVPANVTADSLGTRFLHIAAKQPLNQAVTTRRESYTYRALQQAALAVAARISQVDGYIPGTPVILIAPNSFEYIASFYGIMLAGAVVVPLPPTVEQESLARIIESTDASVIISTQAASRRLNAGDSMLMEVSTAQESHDSFLDIGLNRCIDDLAAIFFTSGSTGTPKGVMLSHGNLLSNADSICEYLEIKSDERPLCVLPFFHAFGNSVLQSHILMGAELVIDGSTVFPETLIEAINHHQATSLSGVPDLFRVLLERTSLGSTPVPSLRYMAVAGGALQREMALEVNNRIVDARFVVMYGQTEATARLGYLPPEQLTHVPPGCIGKAIPGVALQVVDDDGHPVPIGETGELVAKGPNIMLGYWKDPDASRERIRDGWLYTGDLASIDANGWIRHKGRRNSIVKIAGFRVHPGDLEEFAVRKLPVRHAVAVPFDMQGLGTRMALYVISEKGESNFDPRALQATCRTELPRHLVPEVIESINEFPLNDAMKIDRPALKKLTEQRTALRGKASA